ncbi:E3 ubiquitin-protein ligase PRT1-like isoform X1 [Hibiscus syriacus]|uniref:E3 ubiquitin-protein ligase PRT1-like isoform X1 n=1 Tax=Hibiscus syriacus TaxID=106335 RepID=UPI00192053EF|nr:E3 ubiquitin-protein ligase PRT1-like isoform X1 [Hibiscus syriacus]
MDSSQSQTCPMEHHSPDAEEIPDDFVCCVCLDLLYKPIVLHCGHISCFWCVYRSMNYRYESRCPVCRNPYSHFPGICEMLHFLLLKLYPITYKNREARILEEEKQSTCFSPEFSGYACESEADGEINHLGSSSKSSNISDSSTSEEELNKPDGQIESHVSRKENDQISVADVLCTTCKQLLFRPVVLNCGHVSCQTCIGIPADEMLRCQVCQCLHPRGFPKVCLTLDHFLVAKFPNEYSLRKDTIQFKQASCKHEGPSTCSMEDGKRDISPVQLPSEVKPHRYIHVEAGCDACGMCPIVGDRYRCKDCTERMGFDLCGDCYKTRPKLPGRFNQRHTPCHKFVLINPHYLKG